jgi:penicillin G amidase
MFESDNTISLEQVHQTADLLGSDLGGDFSTENAVGTGLFNQDLNYTELSNSSLGSESGLDSLASFETNQDLLTGNITGNSLVSELNPQDSLTASGAAKTETLNLQGLTDQVVVEIDPSGIPHIKAQSDEDAVFAQGYMHAKERLLQMDYARREGAGTLAEVLGKDALESDIESRTMGYSELAESAYQNLSPEAKKMVDAYTTGINAYLNSNPTLPSEYQALKYQPEAWKPIDVMVTLQAGNSSGITDGDEISRAELLQKGLSKERIEELVNLDPENTSTIIQSEDIQQFQSSVTSPSEVTEATASLGISDTSEESVFPESSATDFNSNNWVISGDKTTTGKPFLANDPHSSLSDPSAWYQAKLESPNLDVVGASSPGIPGIAIGHNQDIAWGQTSTGVDAEDYYLLQETEDKSGYIYNGQVKPYEIREETIKVKDAEPVTLQVKESVYGPVVSELMGETQPIALHSVALEPTNGKMEAILGIDQASNWEEFKEASQLIKVPGSNLVYADVEGNIGYIAPGQFPIRQPEHTGEYPVVGTGEFDWQGFIPEQDVPQVYNPESGYIVTANNTITPDNYPYEINGRFAPPYRSERISELINSKDKLSLEDMQNIQLDQVSLLYRDFRPILEKIEPISEQGKEWRDRLLAWDGNTQPSSQEATVFETWYTELTKLPAQETGEEYFLNPVFLSQAIQKDDPAFDRAGSEPGLADETAQALENALDRFGDSIPAWGDIHKLGFQPLDSQSEPTLQVPYGGDDNTVNVGIFNEEDFSATQGVNYRQIVDLSNPDNSLFVNPPGQSSDFNSENYADQLPLWQQGEYLPMR